jgi:hypothetical protein
MRGLRFSAAREIRDKVGNTSRINDLVITSPTGIKGNVEVVMLA